jgi:hypothetical protein
MQLLSQQGTNLPSSNLEIKFKEISNKVITTKILKEIIHKQMGHTWFQCSNCQYTMNQAEYSNYITSLKIAGINNYDFLNL